MPRRALLLLFAALMVGVTLLVAMLPARERALEIQQDSLVAPSYCERSEDG